MENQKTSGFNFGPLFIASAAFLWATDSFVRSKFETSFTSPQVVFLEHVIISIILLPMIIKHGPKLLELNARELGAVLFVGIGGSALATIAFTQGLFTGDFPFQYIAVIVLVQQVQPIFAVGFAHLFLKEKLPSFFYPLAVVSFIGVIFIILPPITGGTNNLADIANIGDSLQTDLGLQAAFLALVAAFLWGTSTVAGRYILEHGEQRPDYFQMTTYRFMIGTAFLVIFLPFYGSINTLGGYPAFGDIFVLETFGYLLYVALIVGLLSLVLYYYGLKTTHASVSGVFELAFPISFYVIMPILDIAWPDTIQIVGSIILIFSATLLSYNYGKIGIVEPQKSVPT